MSTPSPAILHFYRAAVSHADVWRQRLDATTNWAVVTNVGVISFAFGSPELPHFVILLVLVIDVFFLLMEARRYQVYDVWNGHLQRLHRYVLGEAISPQSALSRERQEAELSRLARDLGHTRPRLSLMNAIGYRIRRAYLYLLVVTIGAWSLKLYIHPRQPTGVMEFMERAAVGPTTGITLICSVALTMLVAVVLAIRAPTEHLADWAKVPSPLKRLLGFRWYEQPPPLGEYEPPALFGHLSRPEEPEPVGAGPSVSPDALDTSDPDASPPRAGGR